MPRNSYHIGLKPFTSPKQAYDTVGRVISFRSLEDTKSHIPRYAVHITLMVYSGEALISLNGKMEGPYIELPPMGAFDFPVATDSVYCKAKSGTTEISLVAALQPLEDD